MGSRKRIPDGIKSESVLGGDMIIIGYLLIMVSAVLQQHTCRDLKIVFIDIMLILGVWLVALSIKEDK